MLIFIRPTRPQQEGKPHFKYSGGSMRIKRSALVKILSNLANAGIDASDASGWTPFEFINEATDLLIDLELVEIQPESTGMVLNAQSKLTRADVDACMNEWKATLTHFQINRPLGERDQVSIMRGVQTYGADWVKFALIGARKQEASNSFDPKNYVSLANYLHKDKIERLVNIGSGKESSAGIDWGKVFA
jgi:hypothetical protein